MYFHAKISHSYRILIYKYFSTEISYEEIWRTYVLQDLIAAGFEPTRAKPSGFQVHPINHSGTLP